MINKRKLVWISAGLLVAGAVWKAYKFFTSADFTEDDEEEKKDNDQNEGQ
jgi:hypothetical protein